MHALETAVWLCAGLVLYTFFGYPLLLAVVARLRQRPVQRGDAHPRSVSIVLAAHNEEATICQRLTELTQLVEASGLDGEILVVSDGSTDGTAVLARTFSKNAVCVLELPERLGKASALSVGCAAATRPILVFADARQTWAPDALNLLLENFADPAVGAVSGDLVVQSQQGVMAGVSLYWSFEKWLRKQESRVYAQVGVTGAISAVRRELFHPIPPDTLLDDVYWPLQVVLHGYRVVHDERAHAYDRLPDRPTDEFRRKVRTLAGNFQLLTRLPAALLPWRNPVWLQFVSHKLLRLVVPWALLFLLIGSAFLTGPFYQALFWCQTVCYAVGLAGILRLPGTRLRLFSAAASFLVLNAAAWTAFWVWLCGRSNRAWQKVSYTAPPLLSVNGTRNARRPQPEETLSAPASERAVVESSTT